MEIARIQVDRNHLDVKQTADLTRGTVGATVVFEKFSSEWDGLSKTVIFHGRMTARDIVNVLAGEPVEIPWEVLDTIGADVLVGICGTNAEGTLVIPTVWGNLGRILPGANPTGRPAEPPAPDWTQQIEGQVYEALEQVQTVAPLAGQTKENATAALNSAKMANAAKVAALSAANRAQTAVSSIGTSVEDTKNAAQQTAEHAAGAVSAKAAAEHSAEHAAAAAKEAGEASGAAAAHADTARSEANRARAAADEFKAEADRIIGGKLEKIAIKPAASGRVLSLEDAAQWPLAGWHLYGKTKQEGIPSPQSPKPLTGRGAKGTIVCKICGRNLAGNVVYTGIQSAMNSPLVTVEKADWEAVLENGRTYTVSCDIRVANAEACKCVWNEKIGMVHKEFDALQGTYRYQYTFIKSPWTGLGDTDSIIFKRDNDGNTCVVSNLMIECGEIAHPYEKYISQSYVLPTPNGLSGLPVYEYGNYTDRNGQQWICDELDFARGVYIKRIYVGKIKLDNIGQYVIKTDSGATWAPVQNLPDSTILHIGAGELMCDSMPGIPYWQGDNEGTQGLSIANYGLRIYWSPSDNVQMLEDVEPWFNNLPSEDKSITVAYPVAPEEFPIAPELMEVYRKMHTNYLTTTIFNDAEAEQQVQYIADPAAYIDHLQRRISAIENKLEPMNGEI